MNSKFFDISCKKFIKPGYSILEIMLVIGIIAALLAGVLQLFRTLTERQRYQQAKTLVQTIDNAIKLYQTDTGRYPNKIDEILTPPSDAKIRLRWQGPYVAEEAFPSGVIKDPYGNEIEYKFDTGKNSYELFSWGKGGSGSDVGRIYAY